MMKVRADERVCVTGLVNPGVLGARSLPEIRELRCGMTKKQTQIGVQFEGTRDGDCIIPWCDWCFESFDPPLIPFSS